jgi:hypothetical protein
MLKNIMLKCIIIVILCVGVTELFFLILKARLG